MTDRISGFARSPYDNSNRIVFRNMSGESMPAFALFRVDAITSGYYEAKKPNGNILYPHFVNGPVAVANNAYGESELGFAGLVLTNGTFGQQVGPVYDSWEMMTYGSGYVISNTPASGIGAFMKMFNTVKMYCKLDSDLAAATAANHTGSAPTANVSLWPKNSSGTHVDNGENISVRNRVGIAYVSGTMGYTEPTFGDMIFIADCDPL